MPLLRIQISKMNFKLFLILHSLIRDFSLFLQWNSHKMRTRMTGLSYHLFYPSFIQSLALTLLLLVICNFSKFFVSNTMKKNCSWCGKCFMFWGSEWLKTSWETFSFWCVENFCFTLSLEFNHEYEKAQILVMLTISRFPFIW